MKVAIRFVSVLLTPLIAFSPLAAQTPPVAVAPASSQPAALRIQIVDRDASTLPAGSRARKGYLVQITDSSGNPVSDAAIACRLPDSNPTGTFADRSHSAVLFTGSDGRAQISGIQWGTGAGTVVMRVTANKGTAHAGVLIDQTLAPAGAAPVPPAIAAPAPPAVSVIDRQSNPQPLARRETPREDAAALTREEPPAIAAPAQQPEVSITKTPPGVKVGHSSKKKWIILALVAGATAGAVGFAAKGKSSSSGSSTSQMSIGTPTISVGQP